MQPPFTPTAIAAAALPTHPAYREARLQRQVSTYLLYRSLATDERNRHRLEWWRGAQRRPEEASR
jgi:hypothetical protein